MTSQSSQRIILMVVALGALAVGFDRDAYADNWPGWRNDGSGISAETDVPTEWSADRNIRWKTPIDGQGHSSPIVWQDQVLITTVRPTVERHWLAPASLLALSLLCGLALWRLTDGTLADPLGNRPANWMSTESKGARFLRRFSVWLLFLVIGYGTIIAVELAYDVLEKYPEGLRNRVLDKTWYFTDAPGYEEIDTPISPFRVLTGKKVEGPFFGAPRIPLACYYGGVLAMLSLLAVNSTIARRRRRAGDALASHMDKIPPKRLFRFRMNLLGLDVRFGLRAESPLNQIMRTMVDWIACFAAACFLITVHSAAMADLPFVPSGTTWFLTVAIGVLGLIAFNLMLPGRPWIRLAGILFTGVLMFYVVAAAPANEEFGILATAIRAGLQPLVKMLLALAALGMLAAWIAPLTSREVKEGDSTRSWSITFAAVAVLFSSIIYFALANFLLPSSVYARELVSVDRATGDVQWIARCDSSETTSKLHAANTMATPTPVTDGEHVYTHFGDVGLFCVDMNGDVQWKFDDPVQASHWGSASSPILWQDLVIMTYDSDHQSMTVAIDKGLGVERWRSERTSEIEPSQLHDGYATPIIIERDGKPELVHLACKLLVGYDPATGKELWKFFHPGEQPVCTPVVADDLIVILGGKYAPYLAGLRVDSEKGAEVVSVVWEGSRNLSDMPSPVVYDGLFYMITKDGIASCIDAQTGDSKWRRRIKGAYWASLTAAAGKIYFCNANGTTTVVEAGPEYAELSSNDLDESVYASFAISNGEIFVRTEENLICIGRDVR